MDMSGEYKIPAPRQAVWAALNDPDILKQCIPGCEELIRHSDTEMTAKVTAKIGPVKARFGGKVTLSEFEPPAGYRIDGEGNGGGAGFARGGASVRLAEDGAGTLLQYTVEASVGGKLAQIGARLIDSAARKMAEDFFTRFVLLIGSPNGAAAAVCPAPLASDEPTLRPEPVAPPVATPSDFGKWPTRRTLILLALASFMLAGGAAILLAG
ncbi:SRPBCC family protein [Azospirillum endophyticum]